MIPKKGRARAQPPGDPNVCTLPMGTCFCASSPQPSPRTTDAAAGAGLKFGGQPAFVPPRRGGRRAATDVGVRSDRPSWGPAVVAPKATKAKSVVSMDD